MAKRWSKNYSECQGHCGTDRPHWRRGLCEPCWRRERYRVDPNYRAKKLVNGKKDRLRHYEKRAAKTAEWRKANPERVREYRKRWKEKQAQLLVVDERRVA